VKVAVQRRYSSRRGSLHQEFLRKRLAGAARYDRIAGYFQSAARNSTPVVASRRLHADNSRSRWRRAALPSRVVKG
jgi:hypothetical protein